MKKQCYFHHFCLILDLDASKIKKIKNSMPRRELKKG